MEAQCWICPYCHDDHPQERAENCRDAFEAGRAESEAAGYARCQREVAAWLRDKANYTKEDVVQERYAYADAVERGEHIAKEPKYGS